MLQITSGKKQSDEGEGAARFGDRVYLLC